MRYLDSHLHLWDPGRLSYPWLADLPELNSAHLPEHFAAQADGLAGAIVVQADCRPGQAFDEVRWIDQLAADSPIPILGIVAWAALENGAEVVAHLRQLLTLKRVLGVRRSLQNESDILFDDTGYRAGLLAAAKMGLTLDMCVRAHQLPSLHRLLDWLFSQQPEARVVLDHLGKPAIVSGDLDNWRRDISRLSDFPGLWCKLSGLPTEADWLHWTEEQLLPCIAHALAAFGPERCLFGGDWPVVKLAGGYSRWRRCVSAALESMPTSAQQSVWYDSACSAYQI